MNIKIRDGIPRAKKELTFLENELKKVKAYRTKYPDLAKNMDFFQADLERQILRKKASIEKGIIIIEPAVG